MYGGSDGNAIAYYKNGTKKWMFSVGLWVISNPAISPNDVVYFGSENAQMCVF
jgi:outer membrane protein assembly factor BamB